MRSVLANAALLALLGATATLAEGAPQGVAELYATRCAFCHGVKGAGDGVAGDALQPRPTDFTKAEFWKGATTEQIRGAIVNGKPGTAMVPFGTTLKPEEIDALVALLEGFAPRK
jgi:mono/diheme cytochrome c family protein